MFSLCFIVPLLALAPEVPAKPQRHFDITFAEIDGEKLRLDLVLPAGPGPHPVVVCLHGGAWKFGSRKDLSRTTINGFDPLARKTASLLDYLADNGYAAASISYRLAPKHKFPSQIEDAKTAVRFLKANADKYRLDAERVAAFGFSSGGHLACLLATTAGNKELAGSLLADQDDSICCAVNFFGPTDLSLYCECPGIERSYFVPLLGAKLKEQPALYATASPLTYASKLSSPILTLHGTADLIVPVIHAERLHKKLLEAGAKSVFIPVKGKGHGWEGPTAVQTLQEAVRFLNEHLQGEAK